MTTDGTRAYLSTNTISFTVSVIHTATNPVAATMPVSPIPIGAAITQDGTRAYVTSPG